jgi:hypothetical protein
MKKFLIASCYLILICTGCASFLGRNQGPGRGDNQQAQSRDNLQGGPSNINQGSAFSSFFHDNDKDRLPTSLQQQQPRPYSKQDLMMALSPLHLTRIEGNTWRTAANPVVVYGIMSRLLAQTYIISSADRKNMNVQTDWDKFFIDGRLFRNRISVTVFPVGSRQTEVVIKNSVEYYAGTLAKQEENTAWLPSPDLTDEVTKLVESTDKQTTYAYSQQFMRN